MDFYASYQKWQIFPYPYYISSLIPLEVIEIVVIRALSSFKEQKFNHFYLLPEISSSFSSINGFSHF